MLASFFRRQCCSTKRAEEGPSIGAIVGRFIAGALFMVLVIFAVLILCRKNKRKKFPRKPLLSARSVVYSAVGVCTLYVITRHSLTENPSKSLRTNQSSYYGIAGIATTTYRRLVTNNTSWKNSPFSSRHYITARNLFQN